MVWGVGTVSLIQIPRSYFRSGWSGANLHDFGDSSKKAYGAVAYLRLKQESGVHTTIIMAKSKIAPMKSQTTPCLELLASLVAAWLSHFILEKLKPKFGHMETTLWSDSEIVLHWLCSKKLPDSFVLKRIEEIKKLMNQRQWRYCPSASNPADLLSRGVAVGALVDECSIWWKGPKWLSQSADFWPVWSGSSNHVEHEKYQESMETLCLATGKPSSSLLNVIDPERYSSLNKLSGNFSFSCYSFYNKLQVCWESPQNWPLDNSRTVSRHDTVDKGYSRSSFQSWNTTAL